MDLSRRLYQDFVNKNIDNHVEIIVETYNEEENYVVGLSSNYIKIKCHSSNDLSKQYINARVVKLENEFCIGEIV